MKVILLNDIPKLGRKYETKSVSDGFAQNSLIPQGKAIVATAASEKKIEVLRKQHQVEEKIKLDLLLKNFSSLDGVSVEVISSANEKGHLFSGIHKNDLIKALHEQKRVDVPESALVLEKPIKEIGEHKIEVIVGEKKGVFTVVVKSK